MQRCKHMFSYFFFVFFHTFRFDVHGVCIMYNVLFRCFIAVDVVVVDCSLKRCYSQQNWKRLLLSIQFVFLYTHHSIYVQCEFLVFFFVLAVCLQHYYSMKNYNHFVVCGLEMVFLHRTIKTGKNKLQNRKVRLSS